MAVTSVTRKWSSDESSDQSDDGKDWRRSKADVYQVVVDDAASTNYAEAKFATGIPRMREGHPLDLTLRVSSVQPRRVSPLVWEVYVGYSARTPDKENEGPTNPLAEPPIVRWFAATAEELTDSDAQGKEMLNAVKDPFEPLPIQLADLGLSVSRNLATFDPAVIATYMYAVNSDAFGPFAAGMCRVVNLESTSVVDEDLVYFPTTIEIHIRQPRNTTPAKAWWARRRNEGFYYYPLPSQKVKTRAFDDANQYTTQPILLNSDGSKVNVKAGAPAHWVEFKLYPERPFSVLNIF